jgi:hypothetical protein
MFLHEKDIIRYKALNKKLKPLQAALEKFGVEYIEFVQNTWITYNDYQGIGNKQRIEYFIHGGKLDSIYIFEDKLYITIYEFEYGKTDKVLPADILYDENWKEKIIALKLAEIEAQERKNQEKENQDNQLQEDNERKEYQRLKAKFEGVLQ